MTTLQQLLAAHPEAVADIDRDRHGDHWRDAATHDDQPSFVIRRYCEKHNIGSPWVDSIASLLSAIEAKLAADAPLSDEEIEGMKWRRNDEAVFYGKGDDRSLWFECETHTDARGCIAAQHACVDRLWQDIRRLRAKGGEVADAK